jgi:zinc resistance-associated protein
MKSRLPIALALAGVLGCGVSAMTINASADPAPTPPAAQPGSPPSTDAAPDHFHFSDADRAAFLDARIAALHAGLTLTADQEKLWPAVESAIRDTSKVIKAQREARQNEPRPADPVAWLQRISDNTVARGQALKKLADAATPLYASLSDDQKQRLPILLHAAHFHFFGPRMAENDHWRGRDGGWGDHGSGDQQGDFDRGSDNGPDHGPGADDGPDGGDQ